jgi:hypothetical protein
MPNDPIRKTQKTVKPNTQYTLRSKTYHMNFVITTEDKIGNNWNVTSQQIIEFASDFRNESIDNQQHLFHYTIAEHRLLFYINEFLKWYGGDLSSDPHCQT